MAVRPESALGTAALLTAIRQTEHLRRLVDDLLDLSRMTHHDLQLHKVNMDICDVVDDQHRAGRERTRNPACIFAAKLPRVYSCRFNPCSPDSPEPADQRRQVHRCRRRIRLVVEQHPSEVVIRVSDTGRGISADQLSTIFDMFQTGDDEGRGLGVGLAVVKGLTEVHGGTVRATSPGPGRGSEFIVTLPNNIRPAA